jgi:hypothetical protein
LWAGRAFLWGATRKHNQQKMHGEKRSVARFIMHIHGGQLLKDITVKLVKLKLRANFEVPILNERAY